MFPSIRLFFEVRFFSLNAYYIDIVLVQGRTYIGWVNNLGDILIGGIDHGAQEVLPSFTLRKALNKDDHANPSILLLQVI